MNGLWEWRCCVRERGGVTWVGTAGGGLGVDVAWRISDACSGGTGCSGVLGTEDRFKEEHDEGHDEDGGTEGEPDRGCQGLEECPAPTRLQRRENHHCEVASMCSTREQDTHSGSFNVGCDGGYTDVAQVGSTRVSLIGTTYIHCIERQPG